jgi:hypothetical protein
MNFMTFPTLFVVNPDPVDPPGRALETGAPAWPSRHRAASGTIWKCKVLYSVINIVEYIIYIHHILYYVKYMSNILYILYKSYIYIIYINTYVNFMCILFQRTATSPAWRPAHPFLPPLPETSPELGPKVPQKWWKNGEMTSKIQRNIRYISSIWVSHVIPRW